MHSINMYDYVLIKKSKNAAKEILVCLILKPIFSVDNLDLPSVSGGWPKTHRHKGASWEEKYEAGSKNAQKEALNLCFRQELWEAMLRGEPLADAVLARPIILLLALGE